MRRLPIPSLLDGVAPATALDDPCLTMHHHVVRLLSEHQPAGFLLANVTGLLSHMGGLTMRAVVDNLRMIDSRVNYEIIGTLKRVPQRWLRVFIASERNNIAHYKPLMGPLPPALGRTPCA